MNHESRIESLTSSFSPLCCSSHLHWNFGQYYFECYSTQHKKAAFLQLNSMSKLWEFGRKALFYVRVLSGYEERRIRSYRLQLQRRIEQAEERKVALRKVPEQAILAEVRQMVEQMQALNRKLEETEAAIEEYFKPIDNQVENIMKMQLKGEEENMKDMLKAMQEQALLQKLEAEKIAASPIAGTDQQQEKGTTSSTSKQD